jgi:hypothetical protein
MVPFKLVPPIFRWVKLVSWPAHTHTHTCHTWIFRNPQSTKWCTLPVFLVWANNKEEH